MGATFWSILYVYAFFIAGILVADVLLVSGTPLGRTQFLESLQNPEVLHAIWLSVWTSSLSALIGMIIAVPSGFLLSRGRGVTVQILDGLVDIPIVLPPILFGISLLVLFKRTVVGATLSAIGLKFVHEPAGIVLVQVLIAAAYGTRMLKGAFDGLDPRMSAVARTLGCNAGRAFFTVTLPSIKNSLIAALVIIWARALALYGPIIAFVGSTTGYTEVMPTRMYLEMSIGRLEAALAVALVMIAMATGIILIVKLTGGTANHETKRITEI